MIAFKDADYRNLSIAADASRVSMIKILLSVWRGQSSTPCHLLETVRASTPG